jgi:hypothetical protein
MQAERCFRVAKALTSKVDSKWLEALGRSFRDEARRLSPLEAESGVRPRHPGEFGHAILLAEEPERSWEIVPSTITKGLRHQASECLRVAQTTSDAAIRAELFIAAAWIHEEAIKIENLLNASRRGDGPETA